MRDLAKNIGISATAIYHYFPSKELILREVRLRAARALNGRIRGINPELSPHEFLHALGREYVAFADENPNLYKLLFETALGAEKETNSDHPVMYFTYMAARDALRKAADIEKDKFDPRYGAMLGWIMLHGFCSLMMSGVLPPAEGMSRETLKEIFFRFYSGADHGNAPNAKL
jgi:AcrR family transcriptional regulator